MMVITAQVLVVTMDRLMRSLRMSQARSLVPESPVVRVATIRPEETGSLTAGGQRSVKYLVQNSNKMILPLNRKRKNVCLLKIVPR